MSLFSRCPQCGVEHSHIVACPRPAPEAGGSPEGVPPPPDGELPTSATGESAYVYIPPMFAERIDELARSLVRAQPGARLDECRRIVLVGALARGLDAMRE